MRIISLLILGLFWAFPAQAQDSVMQAEDVLDVVFDEVERDIIEDYFKRGRDRDRDDEDRGRGRGAKKDKKKKRGGGDVAGGSGDLPPGIAKRDDLPPGLAKHVEKHGTLPPGLAKRDLPDDLEDLLPRYRKGVSRKIVDRDVVLVEEATGMVLDVIRDVVN